MVADARARPESRECVRRMGPSHSGVSVIGWGTRHSSSHPGLASSMGTSGRSVRSKRSQQRTRAWKAHNAEQVLDTLSLALAKRWIEVLDPTPGWPPSGTRLT